MCRDPCADKSHNPRNKTEVEQLHSNAFPDSDFKRLLEHVVMSESENQSDCKCICSTPSKNRALVVA